MVVHPCRLSLFIKLHFKMGSTLCLLTVSAPIASRHFLSIGRLSNERLERREGGGFKTCQQDEMEEVEDGQKWGQKNAETLRTCCI